MSDSTNRTRRQYFAETARGHRTVRVVVHNRGDRPIQIGSDCHFFEVSRQLVFERHRALGMRLDVPNGVSIRFDPGGKQEVALVALA